MRLFLFVLIALFITTTCYAAPFLVSDPQVDAIGGKFEIQEGNATIVFANNSEDGSIRVDLAETAVGTHTYQIRYVKTDELWGTAYSAWVPFVFTRPVNATGNITGIKLVP